MVLFVCTSVAYAQSSELAVLVGRINTGDRGIQGLQPVKAAFDGAVAYELSYANRMVDGKVASLHWELTIAGAPKRGVKSTNLVLPKNYSTLFFTPGLKLKLLPGGGVSPYVVGGVGLGRYNASDTTIGGTANPADRANTTYAVTYGGGVDFNLIGVLALRGEVRDFITGNPSFSAPFVTDKQHNLIVGAGIVLRW
jgi:opacity protein-like surface antigen